jgi:hypothetical protein
MPKEVFSPSSLRVYQNHPLSLTRSKVDGCNKAGPTEKSIGCLSLRQVFKSLGGLALAATALLHSIYALSLACPPAPPSSYLLLSTAGQMSSTAIDVLSALPPIRTAAPEPGAEKKQQEEDGSEAQEPEPTTPTSEASRLRPPSECPPAPRKPARPPSTPAKRRFPAPRRAFFPVPRDLNAVFRALPPKKRIRAG